jgi:hypothetical protein
LAKALRNSLSEFGENRPFLAHSRRRQMDAIRDSSSRRRLIQVLIARSFLIESRQNVSIESFYLLRPRSTCLTRSTFAR